MKHLFIFLLLLSSLHLNASFNLDAQPSPSQQLNSASSQGTSPAATPEPSSLDLSKEMPAAVQKAVGLSKLSDTQQKALGQWMIHWKEHGSKSSLPDNAIAAVLQDGHYVKLNDGSVWSVSPNAWIYTYYWKAGETVDIEKSPDVLFPTTLKNSSSFGLVNAKRASKAFTDSLQTNFTIKSITDGGATLTLSDGSIWQIPPSTSYMVAGWAQGQSVFVQKQPQAAGNSYVIMNGVTTRSVLATQLQKGQASSEATSSSK